MAAVQRRKRPCEILNTPNNKRLRPLTARVVALGKLRKLQDVTARLVHPGLDWWMGGTVSRCEGNGDGERGKHDHNQTKRKPTCPGVRLPRTVSVAA